MLTTWPHGPICIRSSIALELWSKIRISLEIWMCVCAYSVLVLFFLFRHTSTYMIQHEMFEVLTIFLISICVLWETTLCQLVHSCRDSEMFSASNFGIVAVYLGLSYCLHLQDQCSPGRYAWTLKVPTHSSAETSVKLIKRKT